LVLAIIAGSGIASGKITWQGIQSQVSRFIQQGAAQQAAQLPSTVQQAPSGQYVSNVGYEQAIIDAVKKDAPSVVSIIISQNLPVYEQQFANPFGGIQIPQYVQKGTQNQEVGAGSGFIISSDGLVLTNRHVVSDPSAEYTVITSDNKQYKAKVVATDSVNDLAVIHIEGGGNFPVITLGDSDGIQIGQTAIAIGYALGQFSNTVSVGVISGLGRSISAQGDQGTSETLENVIQTDAAINPGNSGGPLLNLKGEVIGVDVATDQSAQSIGFAIPINVVKRDIGQVQKTNKIVYPFLGVRYVPVDQSVQQQYKLSVDMGALILGGNGNPAIVAGSPAQKAGLEANDVILKVNGESITQQDTLSM
ncbi:MAG: S1C family serine protease, partial [Candidatus Saccharimonadales bacterium]